MNVTIDGYCDHTAGIPDEEMHQHYADLLDNAGTALYGRTTYELMTYWQTVLKEPTGEPTMDNFAVAIDKIPKIVFSHTLKNTDPLIANWASARVATRSLEEEVKALKQESGRDILACSPSMIWELTKLHLIDEYQLCVHPVIIGSGLPLFKNISERMVLKLLQTKTFGSGGIVLYYEPLK